MQGNAETIKVLETLVDYIQGSYNGTSFCDTTDAENLIAKLKAEDELSAEAAEDEYELYVESRLP